VGGGPSEPKNQRDMRYFRMMEAYWMVKALVAQAVSATKREIMNYSMQSIFWRVNLSYYVGLSMVLSFM
jgi:hypothetical protein